MAKNSGIEAIVPSISFQRSNLDAGVVVQDDYQFALLAIVESHAAPRTSKAPNRRGGGLVVV